MPMAVESAARIPLPGGIALDADLVVPDGVAGVVVFAHGSGSSRHSVRNRAVASEGRENSWIGPMGPIGPMGWRLRGLPSGNDFPRPLRRRCQRIKPWAATICLVKRHTEMAGTRVADFERNLDEAAGGFADELLSAGDPLARDKLQR